MCDAELPFDFHQVEYVLSDAACETLILTVQDLLDGRKSIAEATSIKCSDQALALMGLAGY